MFRFLFVCSLGFFSFLEAYDGNSCCFKQYSFLTAPFIRFNVAEIDLDLINYFCKASLLVCGLSIIFSFPEQFLLKSKSLQF